MITELLSLYSYHVQARKEAFPVTNREDSTRSHPEHGRKDSLR